MPDPAIQVCGNAARPAMCARGRAPKSSWVLILLFLGGISASAQTLRAGAAASVITPPIGTAINGNTGPIVSTHVHDELHARALVLDDGATRLAFIVVDNCLIDRPFFDAVKERLQRETGLLPRNVLISCTHTHSGGAVTGVHLTEPDAAYRAWLPQPIVDAAKRAIHNLAPAQAAWGSGSVPQHVHNRRILTKSGVGYTNQLQQPNPPLKMNWDSPNAADDRESGPVDPQVSFLSVRQRDGRPLALLANYSLHYVGDVGPGDLSADYFGVFAEKIGRLLHAEDQDPPFVGILCNGTSGDINAVDFRQARAKSPPYTQINMVANDVAREVHRASLELNYLSDLRLDSGFGELKLQVRKPSSAEVEKARGLLHGRGPESLRTWTEIYARDQLLLNEYPDEVSLPLQVFRIGDLAVAAWPGEIFAVTGLRLKELSPIRPLFNVSLANGWFGYIPPPEQHALGAYETWRLRTSPLETNAIPRITAALLQLLQGLNR